MLESECPTVTIKTFDRINYTSLMLNPIIQMELDWEWNEWRKMPLGCDSHRMPLELVSANIFKPFLVQRIFVLNNNTLGFSQPEKNYRLNEVGWTCLWICFNLTGNCKWSINLFPPAQMTFGCPINSNGFFIYPNQTIICHSTIGDRPSCRHLLSIHWLKWLQCSRMPDATIVAQTV